MESTCIETCKFWKKYKDKCPFYLETLWSNDESSTPKVVRDCSPKRSLLVVMDLSNRLLGVQQAAEQERNMQHRVVEKLVDLQSNMNPGLIDLVENENKKWEQEN